MGGVGAGAILFEGGCANLGIGSRYSSCHYEPLWLTIDGVNASVAGAHFHWDEWQINLDVSYKIDLLIPYLGIKYSNAQTKLWQFPAGIAAGGSGTNYFENRVPVGMYIGCTLSTGKYFMMNIEGRFIDEEAITVSGDLRF